MHVLGLCALIVHQPMCHSLLFIDTGLVYAVHNKFLMG